MIKNILRFIVAILFILSGFVKAVDLVGFSFKMEEYFSPSVFNLPFLEQFALVFSVIVVVLELFLGLLLLLNMKLRFAITSLIILCIFFGFLTFYSAYFNVVTDCGCFGDAIKFTPWESFGKDIVLLAALIILFFLYRKDFRPLDEYGVARKSESKAKSIALGLFCGIMVFVMIQGIVNEPLIDFRDYKVGTDIKAEKAKIAKDPAEYKTFYSLKNSKTGEVLKINQDDYINDKKYWDDGSPWKIEEGKNESKLVKEGYKSEIAKFKIEDPTGTDFTPEIISARRAVLVFSYDPKTISKDLLQKIEAKTKTEKNALVYGISTDPKTFTTLKNMMMDGTAIKTIARSNPFVLVLENGKIVGKIPGENYAD